MHDMHDGNQYILQLLISWMQYMYTENWALLSVLKNSENSFMWCNGYESRDKIKRYKRKSKSKCLKHHLRRYGKNPSRTLKWTWQMCHILVFKQFYYKAMVEWPWRFMSRSKVIVHDTPSHAGDHLCHIWKESIQNYTSCKVDITRCATF